MKYFFLLLFSASVFQSCSSSNAKAQFKVWGNCKMCKKTIETAIKDKPGIENADWDVKTKQMTVTYDSTQIRLKDIQQYIAAAGYDNEGLRGDDKAYANLHSCCQYERADVSNALNATSNQ